MKKKNLIILLSVLLAVLITAAILIAVNTDWLKGSDDTTGGNTGAANELPTIDDPTIGVEETEPSLDSGGEIDFDDLWNAANGE